MNDKKELDKILMSKTLEEMHEKLSGLHLIEPTNLIILKMLELLVGAKNDL